MTIILLVIAAIVAARRRHPEIGRTRVEVDQEADWRRPDVDPTRPFSVVFKVYERLILAAMKMLGHLLGKRDGGNVLGEAASVLLEIDECLAVLAAPSCER